MPVGLVVAGGYSMRFGIAEKALVAVGGEPMLARVVGALEAVTDEIVVDCREDQVAPFENALATSDRVEALPTFVVDDEPDAGPVAGLANGLAAIGPDGALDSQSPADAEEVIVASCDRPGITPELLARLCDCRRREDVAVALPSLDGHLQPLCGAYRTDALADALAAAQVADERRLVTIPKSLSRHVVTDRSLADAVEPISIESVDTPLDARVRAGVASSDPVDVRADSTDVRRDPDAVWASEPSRLAGD